MLVINNFLHGIYSFAKSISKKAYRTCAIIASGAAIIAVVAMGSRDFGGNGKNRVNADSGKMTDASDKSGESDREDNEEQKLSLNIVSLESLEKLSVSLSVAEDETENIQSDVDRQTPKENDTQVQVADVHTEKVKVAEPKIGTVYTDENGNRLIVNKIGLTITEGDYEALRRIVEAEAGNQDEVGRILVANVIINRVKDSSFPDKIYDVIFQKNGNIYQFQPTYDGAYYSVSVSDMTKECVDKALGGEDYSQGALYFTRRTSQYSWFNTSLEFLFIHGAHYFYR